MVANKCDFPRGERRVDFKKGKEFADRQGLDLFETSAVLDDDNVTQLFYKTANLIK